MENNLTTKVENENEENWEKKQVVMLWRKITKYIKCKCGWAK